ncbi:MAG: FtsX-like permease family protein [Micrococcaceae bacterium]
MNVITRGISSAFRNKARSLSVIAILSLAIALALSMLTAHQAVTEKVNQLKASVGTDITVSAAGSGGPGGFGGGTTTLDDTMLNNIKQVSNVASANGTLSLELQNNSDTASNARPGQEKSSGKTNLKSAVAEAAQNQSTASASATTQQQGQSPMGGGQQGGMSAPGGGSFTPPISMTGISTNKDSSNKDITLSSGSALSNYDATSTEALVGQTVAEKNSLKVGSTFEAFNRTWKVVGIYNDETSQFNNNGIYVPVKAAQAVSGQSGVYSQINVNADSMDNVDTVKSAIQSKLGSDKVDVSSGSDQLETATDSLKSVQKISLLAFLATLAAAALFILLMMVLIVKERTKEIGVLKAIGASSSKISTQFMAEAITLVSISAVIGTFLSILMSKPITNALVTKQSSSSSQGSGGMGGPPSGGGPGAGMGSLGSAISQINPGFTWQTLLFGILGVLATAMIGAGAASYFSSKIRPIEALKGV